MNTWAMWTLCILAFTTTLRILNIGFSEDYPREVTRQEEAISVFLRVVWIIWGVGVIHS